MAEGWSEVEVNPTDGEAGRVGPTDTRNSGVGGLAHRVLNHMKSRAALLNFEFLIAEKGMCLASQAFFHYWPPFHWISLGLSVTQVLGWQKPRTPPNCPFWLPVFLLPRNMSWKL